MCSTAAPICLCVKALIFIPGIFSLHFVLFSFALFCFATNFRIISAGVDGCVMLPHVLGVRTFNNIVPIISSWYGTHDYNSHVHILDLIFYIQLQMALADVDECFMHSHVLGVHICNFIIYFLSICIPNKFLTNFQDVYPNHVFHFLNVKYTTHII